MTFPERTATPPPASFLSVGSNRTSHGAGGVSPALRYRSKAFMLSGGLFVAGIIASLVLNLNPLSGTWRRLVISAPWLAIAVAITEGLWLLGAAIMAVSVGHRTLRPLTLRPLASASSPLTTERFRLGLLLNTAGALGSAAVATLAVVAILPSEAWPGAFGAVALDMIGTLVTRSGLYAATRGKHPARQQAVLTTRLARMSDLERLAEIDLQMFDKAYGAEKPAKDLVVETFSKRLANAPDGMFVAEVDGVVEGFATCFRTDVPHEQFVSWEHSTANGTLDGKVCPEGRFGYVVNLTICPRAAALGAEDVLLARMFALGIGYGVEYAYFVSRIPLFRRWLTRHAPNTIANGEVLNAAHEYCKLRTAAGERFDPLLRLYEKHGLIFQRLVEDAFSDKASLDFGVLFTAPMPLGHALGHLRPVRFVASAALRALTRWPSLLRRVT